MNKPDDGNSRRDLPRIPKPGTLLLDLDQDQLRLYSTEEGVTIDETYINAPYQIDDTGLTWALDAATSAGLLARGYCRISPARYSLEGPQVTHDHLMLVRTDTGYLLRDTCTHWSIVSDSPPIGSIDIDLGPLAMSPLEPAEMIPMAARCVDRYGYHPIGFRQVDDHHWWLSEALPVDMERAQGLLARDMRSLDKQLICVCASFFAVGAGLSALINGVWWATSVSLAVVITSLLGMRPKHRHTWSCEICRGQGLVFTARHASEREAREARAEHMRRAHPGV